MPSPPLPVTGAVIAFNEADRIVRCVTSLASVCKEVVVIDSGSTDATVALARGAGARVEYAAWEGFGRQKNKAIEQASQAWVLMIDADEWLDPGTEKSLRELFDSGEVERADIWRLRRRTHFLGKVLRFGWGDERVGRLFRQQLRYQPLEVHERMDMAAWRVGLVSARIEHDTARSEREYREKLERYADLWAKQKRMKGRHARRGDRWLHAAYYWFKNMLLRGGLLDGPKGWLFHACHTRYVFRKYTLLERSAHQAV